MNIIEIFPDVIGGAILVAVLFFIFYGLYRVFKRILPKPKPSPEIYEKVAEHIVSEEPFAKLVEKFSKLKPKEQQKYISAYLELKKLNDTKGGKNGNKKRTK